jgi:hypothetical protein
VQLALQQSVFCAHVAPLWKQLTAEHWLAAVAMPVHEPPELFGMHVPPPAPLPHHVQLAAVQPPHAESEVQSTEVPASSVGGVIVAKVHELNSQASHEPEAGPSELPATQVPVDAQKPQPEPARVQSPHDSDGSHVAASGATQAAPEARLGARRPQATTALARRPRIDETVRSDDFMASRGPAPRRCPAR